MATPLTSYYTLYITCSQFKEGGFVRRTKEAYDYHCSLLDGPMSASDSVTYGVNCRSALNDLYGFHVADGQLPQDVMHLLLEGVLPYELKLMLNDFINVKHYIDLEFLNDRVSCFTYSPEEAKDKPPPIKDLTTGNISMSGKLLIQHPMSLLKTDYSLPLASCIHVITAAVEMWVFAVYLPLMIGQSIPEDEEMWQCFLLLLDILKVSTCRIQSPGLAGYLEALVSDHHSQFIRCYPGSRITPKLHYCVHFPSQITK